MFPLSLSLPRRLQRAHRSNLDSQQAALEACAHEGADVELRRIELDGQACCALYRNGELICLLPQEPGT